MAEAAKPVKKINLPTTSESRPKPKKRLTGTDLINERLRKKFEEYQSRDHPMNRPIPARKREQKPHTESGLIRIESTAEAEKRRAKEKSMQKSNAFAAGLQLGIQKRAGLSSGFGRGATLGAIMGAVTTPKDQKTGQRSLLKMLVRMALYGAAGAPIGSMVHGGWKGGGEGAGQALKGDATEVLDYFLNPKRGLKDVMNFPGKAIRGVSDFSKGLGLTSADEAETDDAAEV